ncbi:MAG TPA: hypothetical protein VMV69_25975 [Pirellulales bacterium]|nr:hypothetical protein [Pirellulales bacterium]
MRRRAIEVVGCGLALGLNCLLHRAAEAQVVVPASYGATGITRLIDANAGYMDSLGDYLVKQSFDRIRDTPTEKMPKSLLWVSTYFERKELNRAYRLKTNPPFLDKEEHRQQQTKRRIEKNTDLLLKGDVTDELNWLLRELAGLSSAYQLLPGPDSLADSSVDRKLESGDAHHLRLTDGGRRGGELLVFRADTADVQDTHWPRALRRKEFDDVRGRFERARDRAVRRIRAEGSPGREAEEDLMKATDQLCDAFNETYQPKQQANSYREFSVYSASKLFLQSLAASVYRLIETNDARAFDGSYRFEGDSAVDLLHHLTRYGLQFAPPEPGDEGTYRKTFFALRAVYDDLSAPNYSLGGALR